MILNDVAGRVHAAGRDGGPTLDDLFCHAAARRPDAIALIDPPNRKSVAGGAAKQLTYAQADRMVSAIAGRLRRMGLRTDAVIALQLANTVEGVLTLLGVLRAGMIAMPLPLLWRRSDMVDALNRVGASALVVSGRIGRMKHFDLALQVAAESFPIRYVCGYGPDAPDGVVTFDDLYDVKELDPVPPFERGRAAAPGPAAHIAAVTWDVSPEGLVMVARSHAELIAGGHAISSESRLAPDAVILSTLPPASFAGLAATMIPWLETGGTLALHHPFDPDIFAAQCRSTRCDVVVIPGPLVPQFAEAGHLVAENGLRAVIGLWRAPERLARAGDWRDPSVAMVDVQVFGETGLIAGRRSENGKPTGIASVAPAAAPDGEILIEAQPSPRGTLALRGDMVPCCAFPPGADRTTLPHLQATLEGFVDTGYGCVRDPETGALGLTGPPPGLASMGGYRFGLRALQETIGTIENGATIAALPDALCGDRLAGSAVDRFAVIAALEAAGANALLVAAFERRMTAA